MDTPDGWWSEIVKRAFVLRQAEAFVAWSDLKALREENAQLLSAQKGCEEHALGADARAEDAEAKLARCVELHEALLNTLAPSKSSWVQHVVRNARAALAAAKGE